MSTIEKSYWQEIIEMLNLMYDWVHKFYSSKQGWCYLSYKSKRVRIDSTQTLFEIKSVLSNLK